MTTIRPATEADLAGLLAIEDEFSRAGMAAWFVMDEAWFRRKIAHEEVLAADDAGLVGWMSWSTLWRMPWIEFARVLQDRRRQGIGRALVAFLEDSLRASDGFILVSSSSSNDADAIAWHRAIGFDDGGRITWGMWPGAPPEVLHYKRL